MLRNPIRVVASIFTIALVVFLLACVQQDTRTDKQAPKTAYIIQAGSLDQALRAANHVEAEITHELGIINAVGAELNPSQVELLRGMEGVKVLVNRRARVADASQLSAFSNDQPSTAEVETIRDEFQTKRIYDGNDGSLDWSGPWVEFDDDKTDDGSFQVKDESQCLIFSCIYIQTDRGLDKYIYREANFDGAQGATLTYSFYHELEGGDEVVAEISRDGGATYQVLKTYNENVQYKQQSNETIDVSAWISPQTLIRFRITDVDKKKKMWIDDVEFELDFYQPNATHAEFIEATELHAEGTQGNGVTVAVVDTGYWPHPALDYNAQGRGRVLAQYNAITNQKDAVGLPTVATDDNGHGTYVTSILLSSEKTNGKSHGVAPMANLVSVKAFGADGSGSYLDVIRGIDFIVRIKERLGIRVLNLSFSAPPQSLYWQDPLAQAVMAAWDAGLVVVTSAGNNGPKPMTTGVPGVVPYVITVGYMSDAFTFDDRSDDYLSSHSSTGPTFAGFIKPDVVAPGGHLLGLMPPDSWIATRHPELHDGLDYFVMSGTSQAAAVTSGVVALLLDNDPTLVPDDVKCRLMATTRTAVRDDNTLAYSVFQQGAGLINARRAVKANVGTGCANRGLDITADRYGTMHYTGPARYDPAIGFYINGASSAYNWDTQYSWDGFSWVDGNPFVDTDGNPFVDTDGNPFVDTDGNPFVGLDGNPYVDGNPFVDADGNPFVDTDGNPFVDTDGNPFVDTDGNPFVDTDGNPFVDTDGNPLVDEINRLGINFWVDLD